MDLRDIKCVVIRVLSGLRGGRENVSCVGGKLKTLYGIMFYNEKGKNSCILLIWLICKKLFVI